MHIDFLGPLTQTLNGNSYVGLAVCALTKYVEAAGKIANTKLTFFKHQNTLEIQTYYNRRGGGEAARNCAYFLVVAAKPPSRRVVSGEAADYV